MKTALLGNFGAPRRPQAGAHAGPAEYRSAEVVAAERAPASTPALRAAVCSGVSEQAPKTAVMRNALVVGSVVAAVVTWLATSGAGQATEPELAMLLRGMAAIKGLLAVSAAGVVWWRLGQPASARAAVAYIACTWALFAATVLIWQLALISAAAVLFHAGGFVGLVVAMREGRQMLRFGRQAPNPSIERTA